MKIQKTEKNNYYNPSFGIKLTLGTNNARFLEKNIKDSKLLEKIIDAFEKHPSPAEVSISTVQKSFFSNRVNDNQLITSIESSFLLNNGNTLNRELFDLQSNSKVSSSALIKNTLRKLLTPTEERTFHRTVGVNYTKEYTQWREKYIKPIWEEIKTKFVIPQEGILTENAYWKLIRKQNSNMAYKNDYQLEKEAKEFSKITELNPDIYIEYAKAYNDIFTGLVEFRSSVLPKILLKPIADFQMKSKDAMPYLVKIADIGYQWKNEPNSTGSLKYIMDYFPLNDKIEKSIVKNYLNSIYKKTLTTIKYNAKVEGKKVFDGYATIGYHLKKGILSEFEFPESAQILKKIEMSLKTLHLAPKADGSANTEILPSIKINTSKGKIRVLAKNPLIFDHNPYYDKFKFLNDNL